VGQISGCQIYPLYRLHHPRLFLVFHGSSIPTHLHSEQTNQVAATARPSLSVRGEGAQLNSRAVIEIAQGWVLAVGVIPRWPAHSSYIKTLRGRDLLSEQHRIRQCYWMQRGILDTLCEDPKDRMEAQFVSGREIVRRPDAPLLPCSDHLWDTRGEAKAPRVVHLQSALDTIANTAPKCNR
jgi:hypothetical protein